MAAWNDGYWWSRDGIRLHYRDYAAAPEHAARPPILCIPGLTRNARDWQGVADRLAGRWRLICVDLRGRGESGYAKDPMSYVPLTYIQDLQALIAELGLDRFVLFGTSLGGIITMLMAGTDPAPIAGALLNDVGPRLEEKGLARIRTYVGKGGSFPTWLHAARALAESQSAAYPAYSIEDWLAMAKRLCRLTAQGRIVFDYDMKLAEPFRLPGGDGVIDLWPALEHLKGKPLLLVRGACSDLLSQSSADEMRDRLGSAELVTVPNVGHAPVLDEPEAAAAIDRLLARVA